MENKIKNYLTKLFFKKKKPKDCENINLMKIKDLDSLKILKLFMSLEVKYKIKFSDNELLKLFTISKISSAIIKKINR
jgi:acyl carrier protein